MKSQKLKARPITIGYDLEQFLKIILTPDTLTVNSTKEEHVSNLVKSQIWEKVQNAKNKGSY